MAVRCEGLLPLLIISYCRIIEGVLEWTVVGKVRDYGQNLTLFCNVSDCCFNDSGWKVWIPEPRILYTDVKTEKPTKKYDGRVSKDGYSLIIQNLTEADLNLTYSCLYGFKSGKRKLLLGENVFTNFSTTTPDFSTTTQGISTTTEIRIMSMGFSSNAIIAVIAAVAVLAYGLYYLWKRYTNNRNSFEDQAERGLLLRPLFNRAIENDRYSLIESYDVFKPKVKGSLLTTGIYCDGYFIDCDVHHSLNASYRLFRKKAKGNMVIGNNIEFESKNEFEGLVIASSYLKIEERRLSLLNKDSFQHAVDKSQDLLCRLMLSYIGDNETTLLYLLKVLEFAMEKRHNDISMSIAWRLTWVFFSRIKYDFPTVIDIWPTFRCTCKNGSEVQCDICLSETVIVVQLDTDAAQPSAMFYSIQVIYSTNLIGENLPLANRPIPYPDDVPISNLSAEMLFVSHRNLTLICKSSFLTSPKSNRPSVRKFEITSCVQLYCKAKGLIPIGEKHFPKMFCGLPTKVVEGTPKLLSGIQIGSKIGTDNFKKGTLGGFVRFRGEDAFLTCLHVFLKAEELTADYITLDDTKSYCVKCYQNTTAASNSDNGVVCGKVQEFGFEKNCDGTSIDAALIQLEKGIAIDSSHFVATTGLQSCYLNDICIDYTLFSHSVCSPTIATVSIGAISGILRGNTKIMVERAVDTDIDVFKKTFSEAILDVMRAYVVAVIEALHSMSMSDLAIPIHQKVNTTVEEICGKDMTSETKKSIAEIVLCIYPETLNGDNGDQLEKINQLLHEATIQKTSSEFSAIVSDVHMQTTVLKMTVETAKRMSRRIYKQIYIPGIPFKMGDSGTCIYVVNPILGCIGMAIANHPQGGCIATPIMEILKYFKIRFKDSS